MGQHRLKYRAFKLIPDSTKPLPEAMLTSYSWGFFSIHWRAISQWVPKLPQIAKFRGPTWSPPGSYQHQMGPMLAPWTLLSGTILYKLFENCTSKITTKSPRSQWVNKILVDVDILTFLCQVPVKYDISYGIITVMSHKHHGFSNHRQLNCLFNSTVWHLASKKTSTVHWWIFLT